MREYEFEDDDIRCTYDYMYYLRSKVKVLDLYYSYVVTPWPSSLNKQCYGNKINYASHTSITNFDDEEEFIHEKITKLKYKIYGDRKFYFNICPFHVNNSDTYAFLLDHAENLFYCLGCNIGGNNFDFLMEVYGLTLSSATKILASIDLLATESSKEEFVKEGIKSLGVPHSMSPDEWKIFFHLTRNWVGIGLEEKAIAKREKLFEKIDTYIEKQYANGRLNEEIKEYFDEQYNYEIRSQLTMMSLKRKVEYEQILEKMSNRICVGKTLFKKRFLQYDNSVGVEMINNDRR